MKINTLYEPNEQITIDSYLKKCGVIDTNDTVFSLGHAYDNTSTQ